MNALAFSALLEHTATALNLWSWTAPFKTQSLMRPVPMIPNLTNALKHYYAAELHGLGDE